MQSFFSKLYPAPHELAVFSMGVSLVALCLVDIEFMRIMVSVVGLMAMDLKIGFFILMFFLSLVASLVLPFTKRNFDGLLGFIMIAHMMIICSSNWQIWESHGDPFSGSIAIASVIWMLGFFVALRWGWIDIKTSEEHANRRQAGIAVLSILAITLFLSLGLDLHWAHCYAFAAAYSVVLAKFLEPADDEEVPA